MDKTSEPRVRPRESTEPRVLIAECDERYEMLAQVLNMSVADIPELFMEEIRTEMPLMYPRRYQTPLTPILNRYLGNLLFVGALPLVSLERMEVCRIKVLVTCVDARLCPVPPVPSGCEVFNFPVTFAAGEI